MKERQLIYGICRQDIVQVVLTPALLPPAERLSVHADTGFAWIGSGNLWRDSLIRLIYWLIPGCFCLPLLPLILRVCYFNLRKWRRSTNMSISIFIIISNKDIIRLDKWMMMGLRRVFIPIVIIIIVLLFR